MKKISFILLLLFSTLAYSQEYYNDSDYIEIKESFLNEDFSKLKKLVKEELSKPEYNSQIITITNKIIIDIDPDFENDLTLEQKEIAKFSRELNELDAQSRYREMYDLYKNSQLINKLPAYDLSILTTSFDDISFSDVNQLIKTSLEIHGDRYRIAWALDIISSLSFQRKLCAEVLEDNFYGNYPAFKNYAQNILLYNASLNITNWENYSKLEGIKEYLKTKPEDPIAIRRLGMELEILGKFEEARELFLKSYNIDPFYGDGLSLESAIICSYTLDDYETATKDVESLTRRHFPSANQELKSFELSAELLLEFGDNMKAREQISEILKTQPTNQKATILLASIEQGDQRYDQALSLLNTLPKNELKKDLDVYNDYLYSLTKTEAYDDFLEEWESFIDNDEIGNITTYNRFFNYFFDAKEFETASDFISKGISFYPNSTWSINNRSHANYELKNYSEAEKDMRKTLDINPNNTWAISKLKSVLKETNKDVNSEIKKLYEAYPYSYSLMNEMKNLQEKDQQITYLESIVDSNLRLPRDRNMYVTSSGYSLISYLEEQLATVSTATDSLFYVNLIGSEYNIFGRKNKLSNEHLEKAMNYANLFSALGGSETVVHQRKAYLYRSLDDSDQAKLEIQKAIEADPLNQFNIRISRVDFQNPTAFTSLKKALDKNMYDYSNLERYIWLNALYPGSNINAIWAYNKCKESFPDADCSSGNYSRALQNLGDPLSNMRVYKKQTNLSNTNRYINFYNSARNSSFNATKQVLYDVEKNQVTTIDENGEEVIMKDDPIHGKPTLRQKGNVWVKYDYNKRGDLAEIKTSANMELKLSYNENNKISKLESSEKGTLDFIYNENNKPIKMILNKKDSLFVYYDKITNEIDSINSNSGYSMSLKITQIFQDLLKVTNSYNIDDIGLEDEEYLRLKENYETAYNEILYEESKLTKAIVEDYEEYVVYLKNNLSNDADFAVDALDACMSMMYYLDKNLDISLKEQVLNFSVYFYDILKDIRRQGIANEYWTNWNNIVQLLENEKQSQTKLNNYRKKIESIQLKFKNDPLQLLASAEWLPKSTLNNNAYWTSTRLDEIYVNYDISNTQINHILKRENGDVVIAFSEGIAVKQNGFWKFLYYDTLNKKLLQDPELINIKSKTTFNYFAESIDQQLYVNTSSGTFILDDEYSNLKKIKIEANNYIGNESCKLLAVESFIIMYNNSGINVIKNDEGTFNLVQHIEVANNTLRKVLSYSDDYNANIFFLQTDSGIEELTLDHITNSSKISNIVKFEGIKDFEIVYQENGNYIYFINNNTLFKQGILGSSFEMDFVTKPQEVLSNIVFNKVVFGLCLIPVENDELELGVLTDMGINIYKDNHFELFKIESKNGLDEFTKHYYTHYSNFGIISKEKFIEFSTDDYFYSSNVPKKIKTLHEKKLTLMLEHDNLYFSNDEYLYNSSIVTDNYGTNITDFDVDKDETVFISDYQTVYKVNFGDYLVDDEDGNLLEQAYVSEKLFSIDPFEVEDFYINNTAIKQLKVAKDGTIWVTTNLSVFRYNPNKSPVLKEFNFFKNKDEFPAKSLEVFNIIETYNGDIFVINSSESWNNYKGVELDGGLVVYNEKLDKFEFIDTDLNKPNFPWFITSYTEVDNEEAILGTTSGFAYHGKGGIKNINKTENKSYLDIEKNHKNLFLGTQGVVFGDFMLFGCGEGILAYKDNQWFYPDRLNQLLPQFAKHGLWGGNKVNAIEVDHLNRLNIATDLGLLIINSIKIDPNDLMMMSRNTYEVMEYHDIGKLKKERDLLIASLPSKSDLKKTVEEAEELQDEIINLEEVKHSFASDFKLKETQFKTINIDSVDTEINRITKKHSALLLTLKEKNPVIYQSLKVPPLGIAGIRSKLKNDECIVQYIPLKDRLIIQVVTKNKLILKEVVISKEELFNLSLIASDLLSDRDFGRGSIPQDNKKTYDEINLDEVLEQLYNYIISPIQVDILPYKNKVQIIAEGALNYLPFESLIFKDGKDKNHYALENFNFTYLSSLYMLQLLYQFPESQNGNSLLVGDPDNSLPGARKEVEDIAKKLTNNPVVLVSNEATISKFKSESSKKEIIHLATHGYVDRNTIKDSWLLFADSKLKLNEVYELNLDETNLLVLSACETGLGKDGLETTSLARAFANAGVQNIIASLWRVNDESTKIIMTKFYDGINNGLSYMDALYQAKLYLLEYNEEEFKNPKYWAPFLIFGKS